MSHEILEYLHENLTLNDPGLVGCRRRGVWSKGEKASWRWIRGNATLEFIGDRDAVKTEAGWLTFYVDKDYGPERLLQFRGGKWNLDWVEDFYDIWSLVVAQKDLSRTIIVVHEYRGELDIKEVEVPEAMCPILRVQKILEEASADPPGRIPKSGERAIRICPHCPHKQRCDAEDKLRGDINDWSPSYPRP